VRCTKDRALQNIVKATTAKGRIVLQIEILLASIYIY